MADINFIQAKIVLGIQDPIELPIIAAELLGLGIKSESLIKLSELNKPTIEEVGELFNDFLKQINLQPIEVEKAAMIVAENIAQQIIDGEIAPYDGAKKICIDAYMNANQPDELEAFVGLANEFEDLSDDAEKQKKDPNIGTKNYEDLQELCLEEIISAAKDLALKF